MIAWLATLFLMQEPPPPPAAHARYGPLTQCLSGYSVTASEAEAIVAFERGVSLFTDNGGGFNIQVDDGDPYRSRQEQTSVETPNLGRVIRLQRTYATGPETTYLIPSGDGRPAMLVHSGSFDGTQRDLGLLARIVRIDREQGCGPFRAPAYPGETPDAERWRPSATPGPFFHCQNGIGFPVLAAEAIQSGWWRTEEGQPLRISLPNPIAPALDPIHLVLRGPIDPVTGTGAVAARFRPRLERMSDGPAILLMPPLTEPIRYGQDPRYRHWIEIDYPSGQEVAARAFAARIEFVDSADSRCRTG